MEILNSTTVTCTQRQEKALNGLDRIHQAAKKDKISFSATLCLKPEVGAV